MGIHIPSLEKIQNLPRYLHIGRGDGKRIGSQVSFIRLKMNLTEAMPLL